MARFLEGAGVKVLYPALPSHPQHNLAMSQMSACGPIFSFIVDDRKQAMALLNALELIDISNNVGDSRSLMTHPASTALACPPSRMARISSFGRQFGTHRRFIASFGSPPMAYTSLSAFAAAI